MNLVFTPVTAAVLKSAEWTRRRILEDREFHPTPHFNQRIDEAGHMSLDEALAVVREGSVFTCKPQPTLNRFGFVWNNKVVIADSIMDRNHSENSKVFLITCYDRDKPLDDGLVETLPLKEAAARDRVGEKIVEIGAATLETAKDVDARVVALTERRTKKTAEATLADRAKLEAVKTRLTLEIEKLEELLTAMRLDLDDVLGQLGDPAAEGVP
jgi:hypothetical protein